MTKSNRRQRLRQDLKKLRVETLEDRKVPGSLLIALTEGIIPFDTPNVLEDSVNRTEEVSGNILKQDRTAKAIFESTRNQQVLKSDAKFGTSNTSSLATTNFFSRAGNLLDILASDSGQRLPKMSADLGPTVQAGGQINLFALPVNSAAQVANSLGSTSLGSGFKGSLAMDLGKAIVSGQNGGADSSSHASNAPKQVSDAAVKSAAIAQLSSQGTRFEPNVGQTNAQVDFLVRGLNYNMYLTGPSVVIQQESSVANKPGAQNVLKMDWVGANQAVTGSGENPTGATTNYLIGNNQTSWHTDLSTYQSVRYAEMYKGIDVVYYAANNGSFEYDAIVSPGANVGSIQMKFEGANSVAVDSQGQLNITVGDSTVTKSAPVAYQLDQFGQREYVESNFLINSDDTVGFEVGQYDHSRPLTIDPTLGYSTFLGGGSNETAWDVFVTSSSQVYITGTTISANFPTSVGAYDTTLGNNATYGNNRDAFITKLNPTLNGSAALVYSTFVGGNGGSRAGVIGPGDEDSYGIAVDSDGSAYITGSTNSFDYPTTDGTSLVAPTGYNITNAFMTKLNPNGNGLEYSSIVGRGRNQSGTVTIGGYNIQYNITDISQIGRGIAVDQYEVAYIAGYTGGEGNYAIPFGATFPSDYFHLSDAFAARFPTDPVKSDGARTVQWNISGPDPYGNTGGDLAYAINLDPLRNVYITGTTSSTNFASLGVGGPAAQPSLSGAFDAFVLKEPGSLSGATYSTYLGGTGEDVGYGIAVDTSGAAYVTGTNGSGNSFPTTVGAYQRVKNFYPNSAGAFVTKVNTSGTAWAYSTFIDVQSMGTRAFSIALDTTNNAYVTGHTNSFVPYNVMVAKLNSTGSTLLGSYVWGAGESSVDSVGYGVAVDSTGKAYVVGYTDAYDFPTTLNSFDTSYNNGRDAFFSRITF